LCFFLALTEGLIVVRPHIEQGACMLAAESDGIGVLIDAGTFNVCSLDQLIAGELRDFAALHPIFTCTA
jgi:hypothetical protein